MPPFLHRRLALLIAALALVLTSLATPSLAQRRYDNRQARAGVFDYYALVLSWSPTYCEEEGDRRRSAQCRPRRDRPYAFVLHGLWPQYERGFPNNCRIDGRPFVPNSVINAMLDVMPARGLIIHEYKKHGTCSGLTPARYYGAARKLFEFIKIPERYIAPRKAQFVSPRDVIDDFVKANPGLKPNMIAVSCRRSRSSQLRDVRICFTPKGRLRPCGQNERQRRLCRADRMYVPPVRFSR